MKPVSEAGKRSRVLSMMCTVQNIAVESCIVVLICVMNSTNLRSAQEIVGFIGKQSVEVDDFQKRDCRSPQKPQNTQ